MMPTLEEIASEITLIETYRVQIVVALHDARDAGLEEAVSELRKLAKDAPDIAAEVLCLAIDRVYKLKERGA